MEPTGTIARLWRGRTTAANAAAYFRHLTERVFPELGEIRGHRGAYVLRRELADGPAGPSDGGEPAVEFLVLTFWDSMDAVRAFAGDDPDRAVVEPAARAVLSGFDDVVRHYTVAYAAPSEGHVAR